MIKARPEQRKIDYTKAPLAVTAKFKYVKKMQVLDLNFVVKAT